jgi:uncharacterized membrane protein YhiD involved in acid resistance
MALAVGLIMGTGTFYLALFACVFTIAVLWLLESLEPDDRTQFDLTVETKNALRVRPHVERALRRKGIGFELWGSSPNELRYEVSVPLNKRLNRLTKAIRNLDRKDGIIVDWQLKKPKVVQT